MGVCLSCTRRDEDELFPQERTGLLSEYGPTSMNSPQAADAASLEAHREEAMARIVAMTEENLIDVFAVGMPDRRVNGLSAVDYKTLLSRIQMPQAIEDANPVILPADSINQDERALMAALGKASSEYVKGLYTVRPVGSLVFMFDD